MLVDLLVIAENAEVPEHLRRQSAHVVPADAVSSPNLTAHLRSRVVRTVGVVGSASLAKDLAEAGFDVTLFDDREVATSAQGPYVLAPLPVDDVQPQQTAPSALHAAESVLDLVGDTPLVHVKRMVEIENGAVENSAVLVAKLEYLNPGGSVKDRPAVKMIEEAEKRGDLKPGGTIVEPTSGNTGVGLAIVAARRKYRCIFVVPDKVSTEKINLLRAYGAEVVVCPTAVAPEHPDSYYSVSNRLAQTTPGAYKPDQYSNPDNPVAHYETTGPEIWQQTGGRVTHFVAGVGTAGTIVGVARYLKEMNPDIKIVGADPEGSVYSGGTGRPYLVEGVGEDFFPGNYDASMIDEVIAISDEESFRVARRLTTEEGIFAGGSSGLAMAAALQLQKRLNPSDVVVVLLPDSGRGYLSKLYSDSWMADYGFSKTSGPTAFDILKSKSDSAVPELVHVHPHETVNDVAATMREFGVSQVVVVNAEPPLVMGEVLGGADEEGLLRKVFADSSVLTEPISQHMEEIPQTIGTGESVSAATQRLQSANALLVVDAGSPIGILTRSDLLKFLSA